MEFDKFTSLANMLNINVEKTAFDKLTVYFDFLMQYNKKINLTSITQKDEVFLLHFLDSMLGASLIEDNSTVCDIGTGAGFPGVVLKIIKPQIKLTLIDSLQKRIVFLEELKQKLGIDYTCYHSRAEDAGNSQSHREQYDIVVSRALAKLNTLYEYAIPLVKIGGKFIAYKAACEQEIENSMNVPKKLGGEFVGCKKLLLPQAQAERWLLSVRKISATPKQFPRGRNKERENPLS